MRGDVVEGSESFSCFTRWLRFWEDNGERFGSILCFFLIDKTSPKVQLINLVIDELSFSFY